MLGAIYLDADWNKAPAGRFYSWSHTLLSLLRRNTNHPVAFKALPRIGADVYKHREFALVEIAGKLIGIDCWDTFAPTSSCERRGLFKGALRDVSQILKIQYFPCDYWTNFQLRTGIKVTPWTMFPTHSFPLESFSWRPGGKYLTAVTGRNDRFGRPEWVDFCQQFSTIYSGDGYKTRVADKGYLEILAECQWGLILKGLDRKHDGKNRREVEFSSCGMPLALNYCPTYPFEFTPGKHFVHLRSPEDIASLSEIDPLPFSAAAKDIYQRYFSPNGMSDLLLEVTK